MRRRFAPRDPAALMLRFHTQTAGVSLTAQQPYNNVVRVALQALAAVLGGTQSLHTNSLDETLALPTEAAVTLALRTQQIIAHESGVTQTVDPLGGAFFIESLTRRMETAARAYFKRLDALGGMVAAIRRGFPQREIHEAALAHQRAVDAKQRLIVGMNAFTGSPRSENRRGQISNLSPSEIPTLKIPQAVEDRQVRRLRRHKARRDRVRLERALARLRNAAEAGDYLMPLVIDAVKSEATVGEICDLFRAVWGDYREGAEF